MLVKFLVLPSGNISSAYEYKIAFFEFGLLLGKPTIAICIEFVNIKVLSKFEIYKGLVILSSSVLLLFSPWRHRLGDRLTFKDVGNIHPKSLAICNLL